MYCIMFFRMLKAICEVELTKLLTCQTVAEVCLAALDFNAPNLKKSCMELIAQNLTIVVKSKAFKKLMQKYPELLCEEPDSEDDEVDDQTDKISEPKET